MVSRESFEPFFGVCRDDFMIGVRELSCLDPSGVICHCCLEKPLPFSGFGELILKIDSLCDSVGAPEANPKRRRLGTLPKPEKKRESYHKFSEFNMGREELCVVFLTVRYRQNVSWQGTVRFAEDTNIYPFRSILELIGYMAEKFEKMGRRTCLKNS